MAQAQDVFVWETSSWERYSRGPHWYIFMTLIAVVAALYGIFTANYLFSFIVLFIAIILILAGNEPAHAVLAQVGNNGIVLDGKFFPYEDLRNFSIIYQPPETKILYIESKRLIEPRIRISLMDEDPVAIRSHLRQFLSEDLDLQEEHFSDTIARLLKI